MYGGDNDDELDDDEGGVDAEAVDSFDTSSSSSSLHLPSFS